MVMIDTNGSVIWAESLENVIFAVFTLIGKINGLRSDEETVLVACSIGWLVVLTLHCKKMWFVLQTREYCSPGHNNIIDSPRPVPDDHDVIILTVTVYHSSSTCY